MAEVKEVRKRATAYKLRIGEVLKGKPIIEEGGENPRLRCVELGNRQITRVNIVANIVDKYENQPSPATEGQPERKAYSNFTIDDASGQIKIKVFGEETVRFSKIVQGDTITIIGNLRFYNNELYISPEIIKTTDPRYLLVRKLELEREMPKQVDKNEAMAIKDQIIDMIRKGEEKGGIDTDEIYHTLTEVSPDIISQEIQKMLEEGLAFEPRPGKIRYLG